MTTVCLGFDFDALGIWISTFKQITPTPLSRGEFGGRVGVTRILDVLAERKVQGTFFVPAHSARSFPDAVRRMTADARPNRLSLARRMASSSLLNGRTHSTGPKISSHQAALSSGTSVRMVGSMK